MSIPNSLTIPSPQPYPRNHKFTPQFCETEKYVLKSVKKKKVSKEFFKSLIWISSVYADVF